MYKIIEYLHLQFRIFMSRFFEGMTCRTKPDYQALNSGDDSVENTNHI